MTPLLTILQLIWWINNGEGDRENGEIGVETGMETGGNKYRKGNGENNMSWTSILSGGAAILGTVGSLLGAKKQSKASSQSSSIQTNSSLQQMAWENKWRKDEAKRWESQREEEQKRWQYITGEEQARYDTMSGIGVEERDEEQARWESQRDEEQARYDEQWSLAGNQILEEKRRQGIWEFESQSAKVEERKRYKEGLARYDEQWGASQKQQRFENEKYNTQLEMLRETRVDIARAVEQGLIDLDSGVEMAREQLEPLTGMDEYNAARGLLKDPSSIMDRPSVQFQYGQGVDTLKSVASKTSGGGASGLGMASAMEYGQNFASQALDAELARLSPFINTMVGARTNLANVYTGAGTAKSNLRLGGTAQLGALTGQLQPGGVSNQPALQPYGGQLHNGGFMFSSPMGAPFSGGQMLGGQPYGGSYGMGHLSGGQPAQPYFSTPSQPFAQIGNARASNAINQANISSNMYSGIAGSMGGALNNFAALRMLQ